VLLTHEDLSASVAAVAKDVAGVYTRFGPPFVDEHVASRFAQLSGVHPSVAERLAAVYCSMSNALGDGGKTAVLVACGVVLAAQQRLPGEGRTNLAPAIERAAGRAAERAAAPAQFLRSPAELLRAVVPAAGGDVALAKAFVEAFSKAGRNGAISVERGPATAPLGAHVVDGEHGVPGTDGWIETVVVRGQTQAETDELYLRACGALHATRAAIAGGVVPGGGVAYALAADPATASDDPFTERAAFAMGGGLELPLRARAEAAGAKAPAILAAIRSKPDVTFDQSKSGLVPVAQGPLDAARVVQGAIREAGPAASDLLRRAL